MRTWLKENWFKKIKAAGVFLVLVFATMTVVLIVSGQHLDEEELLLGAVSISILIVFIWNKLSKRFSL